MNGQTLRSGPAQPVSHQLLCQPVASQCCGHIGACKIHIFAMQLVLQYGFNAVAVDGKTGTLRAVLNDWFSHQDIPFMYVVIFRATIKHLDEHYVQMAARMREQVSP